MLSLEDIIQNLAPHQEKIPFQADQLHLEKNFPVYVSEFKDKYFPSDIKLQTLPPIPYDSFLVSFMYLVDPQFGAFREDVRTNALVELRKKMGFELDEKDLHKKFGYSRKRKFKKVDLQKRLFQVQKTFESHYPDELVNNALQQYLVDFWSVNVLVLDSNNRKLVPILAGIDQPNPWKPTIFLFLEGVRFYPLVDESRDKQYYLLSQDPFLKTIYEKFTKLKLEVPSIKEVETIEVDTDDDDIDYDDKIHDNTSQNNGDDNDEEMEDNDENEEDEKEKQPEINWDKLTLKELQKMAADKAVSIWRKSDKTGKNIFKKKAELIDDLKE